MKTPCSKLLALEEERLSNKELPVQNSFPIQNSLFLVTFCAGAEGSQKKGGAEGSVGSKAVSLRGGARRIDLGAVYALPEAHTRPLSLTPGVCVCVRRAFQCQNR